MATYFIYRSVNYLVQRIGAGVHVMQRTWDTDAFPSVYLQGDEADAFEALMDKDFADESKYSKDDACAEYF